MLKNRVMKQQSRSFESARKACVIADVNVDCKMTSVITLDGVTCKTLQIHVNIHAKQFNYCRSGGKLEEAEDFNVFSSFIACSNRNRSALARS